MEERIYGLDPGKCNPQEVSAMTDWELFMFCHTVTSITWNLNHDIGRYWNEGCISDEEFGAVEQLIGEALYSIEYLTYTIVKRNNIEVNEPAPGKHITPNPEEFMKWYNFYKDHFENEMPQSAWDDFARKHNAGADISDYLPKGDWRKHQSK